MGAISTLDTAVAGSDEVASDPLSMHAALDPRCAADAAIVAVRLTAELARWNTELGLDCPDHQLSVCALAGAFTTPWLPARAGSLTARTMAWLLALDRSADDHAVTTDDVGLRVERCLRVLDGTAAGDDPLATALAGLAAGVRDYDPGAALWSWWRDAAEAALTGALFERRAADDTRAGRPPALEVYLRHASGSIGLAMIVTASWAAGDGGRLGARIAELREPLDHACSAVRLANDLRGHERETTEGTLDALTLGMSADEALDRLASHLRQSRAALADIDAQLRPSAIALERYLVWSIRHYQRLDAGHEV